MESPSQAEKAAPGTSDLTYATATELTAAMAAREVSSAELTEAAISRIERFDQDVNAVCVPDFDRALTAARAADAARAKGDVRPLLGIPMTVKESFNVAGLTTSWGIPAFKDARAAEDAVAVARLKTAGAVVLGKTNVPFALGDLQTYNDLYGATGNPWNLARTAGGSSGGSAAALAAGYGPLSIGSDIAGSLRAPAHYCGVYAHKPSQGLLPTRGHTPPGTPPLAYERDLVTIGPMARGARDLSLMLDLLADPDETAIGIAHALALPPARHDDLAAFRVLVVDTHPLIPTASSVRAAIGDLADRLSAAGAKVARESELLPDQVEAARLYMRLLLASWGAGYPQEVYERLRLDAGRLDTGDRSLAAERTRGSVLSHRDWIAADSARIRNRQGWRELFAEFDIVLCPAMPTPAFPHDRSPDRWARRITIDGTDHDYADQLVWAGIASVPGLPATVAPIGRSADGLPIGAQLIGPMFEDRTPIRFAELLEREFGGFSPPPLAR
ncbi:amidase [Streptosporangium sp. 'caverna']|uniref:amidase n=1 Tax=Streptosporangium sp. 'caverna' TaxID=2202249 RepID=UPI000D7DB93B|nr:amidase [Streptosporangium sp. 'caverna']AWS47108.1 amidase [Streptosporangium sp. 'caverna']